MKEVVQKLLSFLPYFVLILSILSLLVLWIVYKPFFPNPTTQSSDNKLTIESAKINPLQKTYIDKTTQQEVEHLPRITGKVVLTDKTIKYSLVSTMVSRPNEISVKDDKVVFEKVVLPEKKSAQGYSKIRDYADKYSDPERIIQGSKFYGPFLSTYIYSSKGFAFIANPNNGEIYELHIFKPMVVDDYIRLYGEDIKPGLPPPEG